MRLYRALEEKRARSHRYIQLVTIEQRASQGGLNVANRRALDLYSARSTPVSLSRAHFEFIFGLKFMG